MNKFDTKDIDKSFVVTHSYVYDDANDFHVYYFRNTTVGDLKIVSDEDHSHHMHPLMVLMELSYNKSDVFWRNDTNTVKDFEYVCKTMLDDQDYFKPMFKMCTEYVINSTLKELNDLMDYTEYWTGD